MPGLKALLRGLSSRATPDPIVTPATGRAPGPVCRPSDRYPHLFAFNAEKLDLNLVVDLSNRITPERDAILLFVFGYEDTFGTDQVNEAYLCRKIDACGRNDPPLDASFANAVAQASRSDMPAAVSACIAAGYLERVSVAGGGDVSLTPDGRDYAAALAYDLDRAATRRGS